MYKGFGDQGRYLSFDIHSHTKINSEPAIKKNDPLLRIFVYKLASAKLFYDVTSLKMKNYVKKKNRYVNLFKQTIKIKNL